MEPLFTLFFCPHCLQAMTQVNCAGVDLDGANGSYARDIASLIVRLSFRPFPTRVGVIPKLGCGRHWLQSGIDSDQP